VADDAAPCPFEYGCRAVPGGGGGRDGTAFFLASEAPRAGLFPAAMALSFWVLREVDRPAFTPGGGLDGGGAGAAGSLGRGVCGGAVVSPARL